MEFFSALQLIDVLKEIIEQGEKGHEREGRRVVCLDYDVRLAVPAAAGFSREQSLVVLKGSEGIWITAFNADGDLPDEVAADLGLTGNELIDLSEAEGEVRGF
ncbi:hypothetical protein GCM10009548_04040 [Streptomyces malaysiensis subsp. malaysiensis]|uniref:Uncharacterized protein n=1 Tax=Streptomyces malaysiensis TaxID=92644 RepID=A0ABX6W5C1_STRMQ|nr:MULTISPECIES: hypothetical protein [Streptomyces]QPI56168.1 hypothetical protein I1A49_15555 [Streptomyces solisilvae]UHH17637.1 hypothetical protein LUV23_15670 [Streptomyces sp. HNM0561]